MPEPIRDITREPMAELSRQHDDLAAMMRFMGDEVGENLWDVEGQVAPYVALRRRELPAGSDAELEERSNAATAPLEGGQQFPAAHRAAVDEHGDGNAMFLP